MWSIALAAITSIVKVLPIEFLERWLNYLERKDDNNTVRLREVLNERLEAKRLQQQIVLAEQGWWLTAMIRPMFAWPLIIYWAKIVVWDKVLNLGVTDRLDGWTEVTASAIIGAYFLMRPLEKAARGKTTGVVDAVTDVVKNWNKRNAK